jgi:hypothetical protein
MRYFLALMVALLAAPHLLIAQEWENSPIYKKGDPAPASSLHRWTTQANGLTVTIRMDHFQYGPWDEGMMVDGPRGHQVIHWFMADRYQHVLFGYDLLLEAIPDTNQVRCTVRPLTVTAWAPDARPDTTVLTPVVPAESQPLILEDGETFNVGMIHDPEKAHKMLQYVRVETPHQNTGSQVSAR